LGQHSDSAADPMVERLAEDHGDDLLRYISRRVRTSADARDIAQEAYVRLLRLERKDLIRDPMPYLYRIAANVLYEFELKRREDVTGLTRWASELRAQQSQVALATGGEAESLALQDRLASVLRQLSPTCRAVLLLHRNEGMTYDEIAQQIGISSSMVKKYLSQALQHCRKHLKVFR
jgi:RNA polymerase sigma-70 factor (ECF subfamily)